MKGCFTFNTEAKTHDKTLIMSHWLYFGEMSVWDQGKSLAVWKNGELQKYAWTADEQMDG